MKNSNKGFSYVEMIIVLAIMALMIGFISITIGTNKRNELSRTSEKLESLINKTRTSALTKGKNQGVLNIAKVDGNIYAYVGNACADDDPEAVKSKGEKLCNGRLEIYVNTDSTEDGKVHRIHFKQSTGGLTGGTVTVMVKRDNISSSFRVLGMTGKVKR